MLLVISKQCIRFSLNLGIITCTRIFREVYCEVWSIDMGFPPLYKRERHLCHLSDVFRNAWSMLFTVKELTYKDILNHMIEKEWSSWGFTKYREAKE